MGTAALATSQGYLGLWGLALAKEVVSFGLQATLVVAQLREQVLQRAAQGRQTNSIPNSSSESFTHNFSIPNSAAFERQEELRGRKSKVRKFEYFLQTTRKSLATWPLITHQPTVPLYLKEATILHNKTTTTLLKEKEIMTHRPTAILPRLKIRPIHKGFRRPPPKIMLHKIGKDKATSTMSQ